MLKRWGVFLDVWQINAGARDAKTRHLSALHGNELPYIMKKGHLLSVCETYHTVLVQLFPRIILDTLHTRRAVVCSRRMAVGAAKRIP